MLTGGPRAAVLTPGWSNEKSHSRWKKPEEPRPFTCFRNWSGRLVQGEAQNRETNQHEQRTCHQRPTRREYSLKTDTGSPARASRRAGTSRSYHPGPYKLASDRLCVCSPGSTPSAAAAVILRLPHPGPRVGRHGRRRSVPRPPGRPRLDPFLTLAPSGGRTDPASTRETPTLGGSAWTLSQRLRARGCVRRVTASVTAEAPRWSAFSPLGLRLSLRGLAFTVQASTQHRSLFTPESSAFIPPPDLFSASQRLWRRLFPPQPFPSPPLARGPCRHVLSFLISGDKVKGCRKEGKGRAGKGQGPQGRAPAPGTLTTGTTKGSSFYTKTGRGGCHQALRLLATRGTTGGQWPACHSFAFSM